ncbi:MAG: Sec-independent protein translocase protein TatB [Dehalococcoidia bacterium]
MDVFGVGIPELLLILVIALLVVGPQRLPEMAAQLARFLRAFRAYTSSISRDFNEALEGLEKEYDEMKGEWKEVGEGLDEGARSINEELRGADTDVRDALKDADTPAAAPTEPVPPAR